MSDRATIVRPSRKAAVPPADTVRPVHLDYYKWAFEQAAHIRAGRFDKVDLANVADEIEDVGKSEFHGFVNELTIILMHMLKWDHQDARRSRSWALSIAEHRGRVQRRLDDSPSLKSKRDVAVETAYEYARVRAAAETDLPLKAFPTVCPFGWDDITMRPFAVDPD